jgi:HEPN domain-containing protein
MGSLEDILSMVMRMSKGDYWKTEGLRCFEDALEDLRVAENLLKSRNYAASCFHSQQAGEKALGGILYVNGVEARGHSIQTLLGIMTSILNFNPSALADHARLLDKYYSPPHYPNLHPDIPLPAHKLYDEKDAKTCLKSAASVIEFVKKLLAK